MSKNDQAGIFELTQKAYKNIKQKIHSLKKEEGIKGNKLAKTPGQEKIKVDISAMSVAKATLVVILLYAITQFVIKIYVILLIFFVSLLFAAAIDPWVAKLEKKKIPRGISIILIYLFVFAILWLLVISFIPLVASQISELAGKIQHLIHPHFF